MVFSLERSVKYYRRELLWIRRNADIAAALRPPGRLPLVAADNASADPDPSLPHRLAAEPGAKLARRQIDHVAAPAAVSNDEFEPPAAPVNHDFRAKRNTRHCAIFSPFRRPGAVSETFVSRLIISGNQWCELLLINRTVFRGPDPTSQARGQGLYPYPGRS